jgi:hypothetical protein
MSAPAELSRWSLFLIGCIGVRLILVIIAKFSNKQTLPYLGYIALIPAIGMLYLWISNSRLTGREAGGKIWWHSWRIAHSALYFAFAYSAINQQSNAYLFLAADVLLGLSLFFTHYGFNYLK